MLDSSTRNLVLGCATGVFAAVIFVLTSGMSGGASNLAAASGASGSSSGNTINVAFIDSRQVTTSEPGANYTSHGDDVVNIFLQTCGGHCGNTNIRFIEVSNLWSKLEDMPTNPADPEINRLVDEAIIGAIKNGANVINLSFGFGDPKMPGGPPLSSADLEMLSACAKAKCILVVGAGNNPWYVHPLSLPNDTGAVVIVVGAVSPTNPNAKASYSAAGDVYVSGSSPSRAGNGTSFAAPLVTALVVEKMSKMGTQDPRAIAAAILNSSQVKRFDSLGNSLLANGTSYTGISPIFDDTNLVNAILAGTYWIGDNGLPMICHSCLSEISTDFTSGLDLTPPTIEVEGENGDTFIITVYLKHDPDIFDTAIDDVGNHGFHSLNSNGGGNLSDPDRYLNSGFGTWGASGGEPFGPPPFFFSNGEPIEPWDPDFTGGAGWDEKRRVNQ